VLGPACAILDLADYRDRPSIDDREFFVSAWCWHPSFITQEEVVFIPEPDVPGAPPPTLLPHGAHQPGLCYNVHVRLVAFQEWHTPPGSPDGGDDFGGPRDPWPDEDGEVDDGADRATRGRSGGAHDGASGRRPHGPV